MGVPLTVRVQDSKTDLLLGAHGFDNLLGPRPLHSYLLKRKMLSFTFIHSAKGKQPFYGHSLSSIFLTNHLIIAHKKLF